MSDFLWVEKSKQESSNYEAGDGNNLSEKN